MRSTGAYCLHLPLHKDITPVVKDPVVVEKLAVAEPDISSPINIENQANSDTPISRSNAKESLLLIPSNLIATLSTLLTISTPTTDPFLATLRRAINEADEVKRKNLATALEQ
jgi:hypothetical protein